MPLRRWTNEKSNNHNLVLVLSCPDVLVREVMSEFCNKQSRRIAVDARGMNMTDVPKLITGCFELPEADFYIHSVGKLSKAEAAEVIRRCEACEGLVNVLKKLKLRERADDIWAFQKEGNLSYDQRQSIKRFSCLLHDAAKLVEQALEEQK